MSASRRPRARSRRSTLPLRIERLDERVAARVNARRTEPGADAFWRGLSAFANHGVLWLTVAGLLAVLGKGRAAVRGLASLGLASAVANLVGKRLIGGERPALTSIPISRRLDRSPTSPSFPSGHTASAAAFATGVALESPTAGAVIAPLAAGVAYSRLHTGAHWFSDVAGGAVIGVSAALLGRGIVSSGRRQAAALRHSPTASTIELPASRDGDGVFIIVNRNSGRDLGRPDPVPLLKRRLPQAVVHVLQDGDDFGRLVDVALASHTPPAVLGVYGGDGSVSALAGIARQRELPLLAFPGGTFNHFTRAADIDSVDQAIDSLIAGSGRAVDVGELTFAHGDPITVLNTASVGLYPAFVEEREKNEKRLGKPLAALIAAIRVVRSNEPLEVRLNGDERSRVFTVFIGIGRYFPVTAAPIERRRLDDGVLDVRVLRADRKPRTRGALALALGGRTDKFAARLPFTQGQPVLDAFTTTELSLVSRVLGAPAGAEVSGAPGDPDGGDPGYAHDGEAATQTPGGEDALGGHALTVRLVPAGLRVYAPA